MEGNPEYGRYLEVLKEQGYTESEDEVHRYKWIQRAERDVHCRNLRRKEKEEEEGLAVGSDGPILLWAEDLHIPKSRWNDPRAKAKAAKDKLWCAANVQAWTKYIMAQDAGTPASTTTSTPTTAESNPTVQGGEKEGEDPATKSNRGGQKKAQHHGDAKKGGDEAPRKQRHQHQQQHQQRKKHKGAGGRNQRQSKDSEGRESLENKEEEQDSLVMTKTKALKATRAHQNGIPRALRPDSGECGRHGYCVISESAPCFGFMDAEFDAKLNSGRSMDAMLRTVLRFYVDTWREVFGKLHPDLPLPTAADFLVIDASSSEKASKHVHGPFYFAFRNIYHQSAFMQHVWNNLQEVAKAKARSEEAKELKVNAQACTVKVQLMYEMVERPFLDLPVYSHNRCFRMYSCSKAASDRVLTVDPAFPIQLASIPKEPGPEREMAIFQHTVIDAAVFPFLSPANAGRELTILEYPNVEAVDNKLARNAFKREQPGTKKLQRKKRFLLGGFTPASDDPSTATHFEECQQIRKEMTAVILRHYKLDWPADKNKLFREAATGISNGQLYCTNEMLTPITRLMLEVTLTKRTEDKLAVRTDREKVLRAELLPRHMKAIQDVVVSLLDLPTEGDAAAVDRFECYWLKEADSHFRLVWPGLFVAKTQGDAITAAIIEALQRQCSSEKESEGAAVEEVAVLQAMTIEQGLYQRGYVRLLGAASVTPFASTGQLPSGTKLLEVFGRDGAAVLDAQEGVRKKVKLSSFDVLQAVSGQDPKGWEASPWKLA